MFVAQSHENNTSRIKYNFIFGTLLCGIYVTIFVLFDWDFWDGVIIDYAQRTDNIVGLKIWFFESQWFLQYYFYIAIRHTAQLLSITDGLVQDFLIVLSLFTLSLQTARIVEFLLPNDKVAFYGASIMVFVFPYWVTLVSSVLIFHVCCVALCLFSARKILTGSHYYAFLATILLIVSFQLYSNITSVIGLSLLCVFVSQPNSNFRKRAYILLTIGLFCLVALLIFKHYYPPSGYYKNYNKISFPDFFEFLYHLRNFLLPLFILLALFLIFFSSHILIKKKLPSINYRQAGKILFLILFWLGCAASPYILTSNSPDLLFYFWGQRHGFTAIPIVCVFFGFASTLLGKKLQLSYCIILILLSFSVQQFQFIQFLNRMVNEQIIISRLQSIEKPLPGVVGIIMDIDNTIAINNYATTWLTQRAWNDTKWYSSRTRKLGSNDLEYKIKVPEDLLLQNPKYMDLYLLEHFEFRALTIIDLTKDKIEVTSLPSPYIKSLVDLNRAQIRCKGQKCNLYIKKKYLYGDQTL